MFTQKMFIAGVWIAVGVIAYDKFLSQFVTKILPAA